MPHQLQKLDTKIAGYEEWYCPECGRHILLRWPPDYDKIPLDPGDETIGHVALQDFDFYKLEV